MVLGLVFHRVDFLTPSISLVKVGGLKKYYAEQFVDYHEYMVRLLIGCVIKCHQELGHSVNGLAQRLLATSFFDFVRSCSQMFFADFRDKGV